MYNIGDLILYGGTGVCRVEEISEKSATKGGEKRKYYVLRPLYQDCVIYTPAENGKVFMRPVISREKAEELIDMIPTIQAQEYHSRILRELAEHYESSLRTHDCEDLVEMTMSIYAKKKRAERDNKKFGAVDERFMKRAEELLFGELAAALDIARDDVPAYISARVKKK